VKINKENIVNKTIYVQCQKCGRKGEERLFRKYCPHCCGNFCKEIEQEN